MKQYSFSDNHFQYIYYGKHKGDRRGKVEIRTKEGDYIPHLHITCKELGGKICLCMDKAEYFTHNNEFPDKFNSNKSKKLFNSWLDKPYEKSTNITNWQFLRNRWNLSHKYSHNKKSLISNINHPDYSNLV